MTSSHFSKSITSIIEDLSTDLSDGERYKHFLTVLQRMFPCDATALLKLEGEDLKPLAVKGLSEDTLGRRFVISEHPRLTNILLSRHAVRFPADSTLPDPYDGLLETDGDDLNVHDCMGAALYIDERPWGVLTLDAKKAGTFDSINPVELRAFIGLTEATVKAALRIGALKDRVVRERAVAKSHLNDDRKNEIVGSSKIMNLLKEEINIVAQSNLTALILGETGVGKELVARQIHAQSTRSEQPLIYVNCAALPENIAESELFGHVKGAFTGAEYHRTGKFELADGGTLFLDEIGELPLAIQAKLLRALQSGEIQRIGSDKYIEVDVRIIVATNRDLKQAVSKRRFRSDLYHRLSVYPLQVPSLRERGKDVLLLAGFFLELNQSRFGVKGLRLTAEAKQVLQAYSWPGNVRELEHLLSRGALKAINQQGREVRSVTIDITHLDISPEETNLKSNVDKEAAPLTGFTDAVMCKSLKDAVDQFQARLIQDKIKEHKHNLSAAARELGLNRSNFYRLIQRLNLEVSVER